MGKRKEIFMRLHDKHLVSILNKEMLHVNFRVFMELEGKDQAIETIEEFGIPREEVQGQKKKISRT